MLPGFDGCGLLTDAPWLSLDPSTVTLQPGERITVKVGMSADVAWPGTYTARVGILNTTPYPTDLIDVTMRVSRPRKGAG